ncbi:hypothetical protein KXD96_15425 [Mycobacterium sp. SMC-2]|uniref:hypothetical protein n=1 Tax=Mycobacterium sp. SMC-2 TaxID=2857058 RepID=UPI0021B32059|nr:hypothetical protein [Mycobacterium sp. SMC-2]UXA04420.1 hypothetical protein KXD96_15425 [Mycobacterium sp. SMC-2]
MTVMLNATEAELCAVAEVLKLAALLDDRAPAADKSRIVAWAEQVHRHRLTREDLLDGLQDFYDSPGDRAVQIGDLIHRARIAKRNRLDKEVDEQRDLRQQLFDTKAVVETQSFGTEFDLGPVVQPTPRLEDAVRGLRRAVDKRSAIEAMREFFSAKQEARKAS